MRLALNYFIIIPLCLLSINVLGQSFAPVGAEWKVLQSLGNIEPCDASVNIITIKVDRQEQVNGSTVNVLSTGNKEIYLKVDSSKIYFYEDSSFHLYMDLNLELGDTLFQKFPFDFFDYINTCTCGPIDQEVFGVVTKDSLATISGMTLKQLEFDFYTTEPNSSIYFKNTTSTFTEKLGFSRSIFEYMGKDTCAFIACCGDVLLCYEDDELSYDYSIKSSNCVYTSIDEINIYSIQTYPNPAHTTWHILSEKPGILELYSLSGKQILNKQIQIGTEQINVSQFAEGIYFYRISSDNGELMKSGKLVKQ